MDAKRILLEEHRAISLVLDALAEVVSGKEPIPYARLAQLGRAIEFLDRHLDRFHMEREEEHLYPALAGKDFGGAEGPLAVMIHRRDMARGFIRRMGETLRRIAGGAPASAELTGSAQALIAAVRGRVMLEDVVLIPAIDVLLNEEERDRLLDGLLAGESGRTAVRREEMLAESEAIAAELTPVAA